MMKNYLLALVFLFGCFYLSFSQTTLAKEDIAIIGVNTDSENFTFLLRVDITTGTQIYFTDNEVNGTGTALNNTGEGIVLFTASTNYNCGSVLSFISNSAEFSNVSGSLELNNGGDELLAFQGYDTSDDSWTTFLHANVDVSITYPVGFTAADIVDGSLDNREYNGSTNDPTWAQLNDISNYNEGDNFGSVTLSTGGFTCTPVCTPTHTITSFNPTSGPIGTRVSIEGAGFSPGTTVDFNGNSATIISQTTTTLVVEILSGTTTGVITLTEAGCPLSSANNFDVIESTGTCTGATFTDLIITEIYDRNGQNNWYMELYNPTNVDIDLNASGTDFAIERYANIGNVTPSRTIDLTGVISSNSVYTLRLGDTADDCVFTADFTEAGAGINENDEIKLTKNGVVTDVVEAPNNVGYSILRLVTATGPSNIFNAGDWSINNTESCGDIGAFNAPPSNLPVINTQPSIVSNCSDITLSITATAGNGGTLTYQWKYNDGSTTNWLDVTPAALTPASVNGETSNSLTISGINLNNYQFYCEVTEDGSCTLASDAVSITNVVVTWDGTNWNWNDGTAQDTMPSLSESVVIDGNYDTSIGGVQTSFSACSLTVNPSNTLTIGNNSYIEIQNNIVANGNVTVLPQGSVVQIDNSATTTANAIITVQKETTVLNSPLEYTYWSPPVTGESIEDTFANVPTSRRFLFNADNFVDVLAEINNTGTYTPGQDDIDDNGDAWQLASGVMSPGVGYAATAANFGMFPAPQQFTFEGPFNNGLYQPTISNASGGSYRDWNFIGNPYPSAIDTDVFFTVNAGIVDNIYLWSQATPPNANASGNEGQNFSGADYAIISASGVNTAGGSGEIPNNYVPSGQGFFVEALSGTSVTFNNSMRVTGDNDQFFRPSGLTTTNRQVLWLNLNSDNGIYNQIAIAHIEGATDENDGTYYDVARNVSASNYAKIYSTIPNNDNEFVIQGKAVTGLDEDEIIELGFSSIIESATLFTISIEQFEGGFYETNPIYLKDNLLNIIHNLKESEYNFTSEVGEFNDRFEIVFRADALSIDNNQIDANKLTIAELNNGDIEITISNSNLIIKRVEILDMLGRKVYNLTGTSNTEVYNLSKLSKAAYIARVSLSNGQVISKKAIKQK